YFTLRFMYSCTHYFPLELNLLRSTSAVAFLALACLQRLELLKLVFLQQALQDILTTNIDKHVTFTKACRHRRLHDLQRPFVAVSINERLTKQTKGHLTE